MSQFSNLATYLTGKLNDIIAALNNKVTQEPGKGLSTNDYTNTDQSKLAGIESGAEVNQTDAEIKTQYEANKDTNAYTDSEKTKLSGIEAGAQVNVGDTFDASGNYPSLRAQATTKGDVGLGNVTDDAQIPLSQKGSNGGVATLDGGGKVPGAQLPSTVMNYKGTWDASLNDPEISDANGTAGDVYLVGTAGSKNLGSGSITFAEGDWVVHNGTKWEKSLNSDKVVSVNGKQGTVVLDKADVGLGNVDNTSDADKPVSTAQQSALDDKADKTGTYANLRAQATTKGDVGLGSVGNYGVASTAEAEAGTANNKYMTPLRTFEAMDAHVGTSNEFETYMNANLNTIQ